MRNTIFTGVCTALVTPFLDSQINYPLLELLLRRQIDAGVESVVIAGTTGEAPTLSDSEKLSLFRRSKEYVGSSCKIIAGTGSNDTRHTIELSAAAEKTGVDGLLIVSPYYNKPNDAGQLSHYAALSQAVDLPFIAYNVPSRTGSDLSIAAIEGICKLPNFAGIKEASSDIAKVNRIIRSCGKDARVYAGNDHMALPVIALGGIGVISVVSNLFPIQMVQLAQAAMQGDVKQAARLQIEFQPLLDALFSEGNPVPVKEALRLMGYDCGECRLPLFSMSSTNQRKLKAALAQWQ